LPRLTESLVSKGIPKLLLFSSVLARRKNRIENVFGIGIC